MSKKILILDDEQDILDMLSYMLTEDGYEVRAVPHGNDVLPTLDDFCPDLVLIDLILGGLDGRSIVRMIKENSCTRNIPVIMMTGRPDLKPPPTETNGPDDFLAKPFDLENLRKKISKYL
jgi:DNA-binding response OmpR family regulator